jgi:hypothetical protein
MADLLKSVFAAPVGTILIIAGICFLAVAVVGNVSGRIEPGTSGRIGAGVLGIVFLAMGLALQWPSTQPPGNADQSAAQKRVIVPPSAAPSPGEPARQGNHVSRPSAAGATPDATPATQPPLSGQPPPDSAPQAPAGEIQHGDWSLAVAGISVTNEYRERFKATRSTLTPKGPDQSLIVVDFTLRNVSEKTISPDFYDVNTGLIDNANRSYRPSDWDANLSLEDCCRRLGVQVLPGTVYDGALVFTVPKTSTPKLLVFTIKSNSYESRQPPIDVQVPLPATR